MQITSSGAHRCVCVQLRLYNLAVAAIERCEALAEMEGAGSIGVDPAAGPAFKVLKQLVHNWLTDAVQNGNRCTITSAPHNMPEVQSKDQNLWAVIGLSWCFPQYLPGSCWS